MNSALFSKIADIVGQQHVFTSPEELSCYSFDGSGHNFQPEAVAFPKSALEIAAILRLANKHRFPVIPRGAGSGMTGGVVPVAGGLVLVTNRMNRILEIDIENMIAVVEPGVITGELQTTLKRHNLMYPPDPASLKFCTIGGNAAECAGGPSAVKYGVTRDYIIGMEVVLPTGKIMQTGVRTEKGVVGYDLTRLLLGSEGTLGIFSKLTLRLLPLPEHRETFLLFFHSLRDATRMVAKILGHGLTPCTLEYMDQTAIRVTKDHLQNPLPEDTAALLLLEIDGSTTEVASQQEHLTSFLNSENVFHRCAGNDREREKLWQARRSISPACFSLRPHKISEDVVVPRSKIPDLVECTTELAKSLDLIILTFGHAGDGNIHVNIMVDKDNHAEYERGQEARKRLFQQVLFLGGTLSGEHGVGITKSADLPLEIDPIALTLMREIKELFDPAHILNPGKIFPDPVSSQ